RLAGLKSVRGDTAGAIADLERAIAIGKAEKQPAESIAWAEWQLGSDYFAVGELEKAEMYFKRSVKTYPNYYRALAGLAQVCAAQNRLDQAIDLYEKAIAILPMPEYAAALGDVYLKIGEPRKAKQQYDLVEYIGKLSKLNQALYNRELAYFYADHDINLEKGLELAARELDYRKDVYAYDLLAWSLYKNGEVEGAREAIDKALKLGTKDAKIFYHAGMIYNRLGNERKALEFLKGALAINPHFHIFHAVKAEKVLKGLENLSARIGTERQGLGG
ncbi:MAG: tetratricopeptide repeat protein, partial [Deltaproteobacteria bacterium]|nr:tetratricopeptide repeat protein [Deltaproteobacteria bacterium]